MFLNLLSDSLEDQLASNDDLRSLDDAIKLTILIDNGQKAKRTTSLISIPISALNNLWLGVSQNHKLNVLGYPDSMLHLMTYDI